MDLVSGYPFWLIKDGLLFSYPALDRPITTDVLIIGAGISGALTAFQLVNTGIECVVADSRTVGLGSTCASTSLLQYEIDVPLSELIKKIGQEEAVTAYKLCEKAISELKEIDIAIKCNQLELKKSLYCAASKNDISFLEKEYKARKEHGFGVQFISGAELGNDYGIVAPAAILSDTGAQTNAYRFTHSLHQYCISKGARVYDRTSVVDFSYEQDAVTATTAAGHTIRAKKVIYANGYEAVHYVDKKIVSLHSTYAVISEQLSVRGQFWKDDVLIWNTDDPYLYARTTKDNRIIVGGRDDAFKDAHSNNKRIDQKTKLLTKDLSGLLPHINFRPEFSWAGVFGSTKDGLPFIGSYPKRPNSYFALGFGGNGIVFSQVAARMITELIHKGQSKHAKLFSFGRL